jgi:hypothetical protein
VVDVKLETKKSMAPIPSIKSITERGLLTISWDKMIKIPRNLTQAQLSNSTQYGADGILYSVPALYISVIVGQNDTTQNIKFTWNYKNWQAKTIDIQLWFENPYNISHGPVPD